MGKLQVLIAVEKFKIGGIQKSLLAFIQFIEKYCDLDVLVWRTSDSEMLELPNYVNRIHVPGVYGVRMSYRKFGLRNLELFYAVLGAKREKRWLAFPRLKKKYDIAIAFSHVDETKYYVIDKVTAKRKYAFYHHGAYCFSGSIRALDQEYYPKYDRVFAVSDHVKHVLAEALPNVNNVSVLPNRINLEEIQQGGEMPCPEFPMDDRIRLLTVIRLYREKNPLQIIETAKVLRDRNVAFHWIIVGDGPLQGEVKSKIAEYKLEENVRLVGYQINPYRFIRNCDIYVQLSELEADSCTVREAAYFNKHMVLSDIPRFRDCQKEFKNIHICRNPTEAAEAIIHLPGEPVEKNDLSAINKKVEELIYKEIISESE